MRSYSTLLSNYQTFTKNTSTANQTLGAQNISDSVRTIASINGGKWPWLETEVSVQTTADVDYVKIPNSIRRVMSVRQQNGALSTDVIYRPRMVFDSDRWDTILAQLLGSSDVPYFCYQKDTNLYIQPVPSSTGNYVWIRGRLNLRDLSIADYSTGSIVSITNGATALVGTGTSWTLDMVGRWIRITETSAANGGDGFWYQIGAFVSATALTLAKPYLGTTITAGTAAYTIGQMSPIPEAYDLAPVYRAAALYWGINNPAKPNTELANAYWRLYDGGVEAGISKDYGGLIGQMLQESNESMEGPYIPPTPRDGSPRGNYPPYWFPWDDATGITP